MSERTASAGVGSLLQQKAQPTSNGSRFASEKPNTRGVERVGLFYGPAITDELNERALITQRQQTAPANNEPVLFSVLTIATTPDAVETMKRRNNKGIDCSSGTSRARRSRFRSTPANFSSVVHQARINERNWPSINIPAS